jgi:NADH:ubiquinone oxidoreductase subunit K
MKFTHEPMIWYLLVAISLMAIGIYGLLSRKSILKMIISIEIIVNGANVGLAAFATQHGADGVILAFFIKEKHTLCLSLCWMRLTAEL